MKKAIKPAKQKTVKFPALYAEFDWENAEWARNFLPQIRIASLIVRRDDKALEKIMDSYIENGTVTELLEAWCDTAEHLESIAGLLNCAMARSSAVLKRMDKESRA